jgi:hypothetical protein
MDRLSKGTPPEGDLAPRLLDAPIQPAFITPGAVEVIPKENLAELPEAIHRAVDRTA